MRKITALCTLLLITAVGMAQVLTGKITDANSNPLQGVNVIVKGTTMGSETDSNGVFKIKDLQKGEYVLLISMIGYINKEILFSLSKENYKLPRIRLQEDTNQLSEVIVRREKDKTKNPSSSLRISTPIRKIPQNIQVVSDKILEEQMITNILEGAFKNVSGVSNIEHWGHFARINMRGFRLPAFRNGVNIQDNWGPLSEDMFMIDKMEFVKGPSGFMMATGEPGGFYNVVTKKPTTKKVGKVSLMAGTQDTYRGALDFGGKVSEDGRLQYRLNIMYQSEGSHRDYENPSKRIGFAPSLSYQITPKTKVLAEYSFQKLKSYIGAAYIFNTPDKGYGSLDRDFTMIDTNFPQSKFRENHFLGRLTHEFNANWSVEAQYVNIHYDQQGNSFWTWSMLADGTANRFASIWDAISAGNYFQIYGKGKFSTGSITHKLLGGFDFTDKNYWADFSKSLPLSPFNVNTPTYGNGKEALKFDRSVPLKDRESLYSYGNIVRSFYLQDEIGFLNDKIRLTLAARQTELAQQNNDKVTKLTPRLGLSVDIIPSISIYGLYDQSFLPNNVDPTNTKNGGKFDPIEGNIIEGGIKSSFFQNRLSASLSAYLITKNNLQVSNPNDINPSTGKAYVYQSGEVQSKGFEFDLTGYITKDLNLVLNYANTNVEITKDKNPTLIGNKIKGHAKHITNGWLNYRFNEKTALKGFGISVGYQYQADRSTWDWGSDNKSNLPNYFRMDGALSWQNSKWRVALNVNNLLNKYLYSGANYGTYVYWQAEPGVNGRLFISYNIW